MTEHGAVATSGSDPGKNNNPEPICKDGGVTTEGCVWIGQQWLPKCGGEPGSMNAWTQAYPSTADMTTVVWESPIPQDFVIVGHKFLIGYPGTGEAKCNAKLIREIPKNEKEYWAEWDNNTNRPPQGWTYDGKRRFYPVDSCEWGHSPLFYQRHLIRTQ